MVKRVGRFIMTNCTISFQQDGNKQYGLPFEKVLNRFAVFTFIKL